MKLSSLHYDGHCNKAGQHKGFLYGMNITRLMNENPETDPVECILSFHKIDTLCKISEMEIHHTYDISTLKPLRQLLRDINSQSSKVNK